MVIITIISAVIIFGVLIFVHELGHFAAARSVGIKVNEFSLGMGPTLFSFQPGETKYSLKAFPIGGSCMMEGEDEESDDNRSFNKKSAPAKALVLAAGSFMNYVLAVVLVFALIATAGFATNTIGEVKPGNPADVAGMLSGDTIVAIDGQKVETWEEVLNGVTNSTGDMIRFTVLRNGHATELVTTVAKEEETDRRIVGITPAIEKDFVKSIGMSFKSTGDIMKQMISYLGQLVTGKGSVEDVVGPVGIVKVVNDSAKLGIQYLVNLTAIISLNLAIVNMLPLPALDGGRLLFLLIECITRKKISEEVEGRIHFVGFMLLMGLMLLITIKDVNTFIIK